MKKYSDTYNELNSLLSLLHSSQAVSIVRDYYAQFDNSAIPESLQIYINKLQKRLDNAKMAKG